MKLIVSVFFIFTVLFSWSQEKSSFIIGKWEFEYFVLTDTAEKPDLGAALLLVAGNIGLEGSSWEFFEDGSFEMDYDEERRIHKGFLITPTEKKFEVQKGTYKLKKDKFLTVNITGDILNEKAKYEIIKADKNNLSLKYTGKEGDPHIMNFVAFK